VAFTAGLIYTRERLSAEAVNIRATPIRIYSGNMKKLSLLKEHRKDWLLLSSAVFTWSLVSFLTLVNLSDWPSILLRGCGLVIFFLLFLRIVLARKRLTEQGIYLILVVQIALVMWMTYYDTNRVSPILLVLIATQLPAYFSKPRALLILLAINALFYLILVLADTHDGIFTVLIFFFLQIFAFSTLDISIREQRAKEEMSVINQELLATRYMLKESTKRQERLRISRDLHDVIGHQLTALSLNLEVAKHQVPDQQKPILEQNLLQAKKLLNDVRDVVKEMRAEDEFDLIEMLQGLVAELPNCQLDVTSAAEIKSLKLKQQLVFCLLEGISNGLRHGRANRFELASETSENFVVISLSDNGVGCNEPVYGSGLCGMKERLCDFKGEVELVPGTKGCVLSIRVEDYYD